MAVESSGTSPEDNGSRANLCPFMDGDVAEQHCVGANQDIVLNDGSPPLESSDGDVLIEHAVLSNHGFLGDDTSHTVVLEQAAFTYLGMASDMACKEKLRQMPENSSQRTNKLWPFGAGVSSFV